MKNWIVMDLDGTLCDCSHRVHLAQAQQWEEFNAGICNDIPHPEAVAFLKAVSIDYEVLLCTGRDEKNRSATMTWLIRNKLHCLFDELIMRPSGDFSSDDSLKVKMVDEYFGGREKALESVLLVLDDRDRVVLAFRDAGFRVWQVDSGSY